MRYVPAFVCASCLMLVSTFAAAQHFRSQPTRLPAIAGPPAERRLVYPQTQRLAHPTAPQFAYPNTPQFAYPGMTQVAQPQPYYARRGFVSAENRPAPAGFSYRGGDDARLEQLVDSVGPSGYTPPSLPRPDPISPSPGDARPYNPWDDQTAGPCESCTSDCDLCGGGCWYGSVAGMIMTRDRPDPVWLTYPGASLTTNLMGTTDTSIGWTGGWQFVLGRRMSDCHRLELVYWGLDPVVYNDSARDAATNNLSTPLDFGTLMAGGGLLGDLFDAAREHRFRRENEIHNIELNVVHESLMSCCGFELEWILGARYFRFDENWAFSSVDAGFDFGDDPTREGHYDIDTVNHLVGLQIGTMARWQLCRRWGLHAGQKVGIYANDVSHRSRGYRGDGASAFNIASNKDEVSFLAELDLGLDYMISSRWRAFATYRAVAVSNVALADDQVPQFISDAAGIANIDTNGHLILHGLLIGAEYRF
ncbi:MAG: BBP7 family outer membrane beta-barrel protein [Planctomycetes bacterium]|nr:BBP7 family outer membrane beta-barrel protein [Planctomycetota bacterium]